MVMIPAGRNECRPSAVTLGELETEDAAVESQGALQIGHFQVHMADSHVGMNRLVIEHWNRRALKTGGNLGTPSPV